MLRIRRTGHPDPPPRRPSQPAPPWEEPRVWAVLDRDLDRDGRPRQDGPPRQVVVGHPAATTTGALARRSVVDGRLGADRVLIDVVGKALYVLNPTAWGVWELTDGRRSAEEVVAEVARRYGIPDQTAASACRQALAMLEAADLVVRVDQ